MYKHTAGFSAMVGLSLYFANRSPEVRNASYSSAAQGETCYNVSTEFHLQKHMDLQQYLLYADGFIILY